MTQLASGNCLAEAIELRRRAITHAVITLCAAALGAGCMPKTRSEQIKYMLPPRAVELDRLEMLLGDWTIEAEVAMVVMDAPMQATGGSKAVWSLDRRMVVEHVDLDMGPFGTMTGMSIWSWDPSIREYRRWWFGSFGDTFETIATYNEATQTWHLRGKGQKFGHITSGRGTLRRIDDDTLEWTWKEYAFLGMFQIADMKGISRRK